MNEQSYETKGNPSDRKGSYPSAADYQHVANYRPEHRRLRYKIRKIISTIGSFTLVTIVLFGIPFAVDFVVHEQTRRTDESLDSSWFGFYLVTYYLLLWVVAAQRQTIRELRNAKDKLR